MTQEERYLLLKDLCGRLPYRVFCNMGLDYPLPLQRLFVDKLDGILLDFYEDGKDYQVCLSEVKPYLRPMSDMTEEECDMVEEILGNKCIFDFMGNGDIILKQGQFSQNKLSKLYDYYNSIHVDYRNLINKNLAIDCTNLNIY